MLKLLTTSRATPSSVLKRANVRNVIVQSQSTVQVVVGGRYKDFGDPVACNLCIGAKFESQFLPFELDKIAMGMAVVEQDNAPVKNSQSLVVRSNRRSNSNGPWNAAPKRIGMLGAPLQLANYISVAISFLDLLKNETCGEAPRTIWETPSYEAQFALGELRVGKDPHFCQVRNEIAAVIPESSMATQQP